MEGRADAVREQAAGIMTTDRKHITRLRCAVSRLRIARNQQKAAMRLVKEAETDLQQALTEAVQAPAPPPDGERRIA